ncbi:hypothetical protein LBMAG56_34780 [Verrucomicrobiota bacterium]|nr:hypothetical protein LBMAG56_34780 [Verrucomicrobiota bacterium]
MAAVAGARGSARTRGWFGGWLLTLALLAGVPRAGAQALLPPGFGETRIDGIASAAAMAVAPDGRVFVCEQRGNVRVVKGGVLLPAPFVSVTVHAYQERGLIGIQFDPDFSANHFVYLYYTSLSPTIHNRLSRFTANGDVADVGSEVALLDLPTLGESGWHNGGSLAFGPDGKLYVGVGENNVPSNAQSLASPLGKILRINRDGSIPSDNPFVDSTTGLSRAIWALGFRNPYTLGFKPGTSRLFVNDVGFDRWEEINEVQRGANYGWPIYEGYSTDPNFGSPVYAYPHQTDPPASSAITGGTFYNPATNQFPGSYLGKYFFVDGFTQVINVLDTDTQTVTEFATFPPFAAAGPDVVPLYLTVANDGSLYYLARGRRSLNRIQYSGLLTPQVGTQPADVLVSDGYPAAFSVSAYGEPPMTFRWQRKDAEQAEFTDVAGATSATLNLAAVGLADSGAQFRCVLSNSVGTATTVAATLSVTANRPPVAEIVTPAPSRIYRAGDVIEFSGLGTDPEAGVLPPSALTWRVDFQHHDHNHPFIAEFSGASGGSFVVSAVGETSDDVWYRIYLTATDAVGLKHTVFRDVLPLKANITLASQPAGLELTLDGTPITAPYRFTGVAGVLREVGAGHQVLNGITYEFVGWSDGGNATHLLRTPNNTATVTANFQPVVNQNDNAVYLSQSHSTFMTAGQTYRVTITMKNVGTTTWTPENHYFLASQGPQDNTTWGVNRVALPANIPPGVIATFNFTVVAPEIPGTYPMQWQMIHDGVNLFGSATPSVPITVAMAANAARYLDQSVPTNMIAGHSYTAAITMKNVGTSTWTPELKYRLTSQNPADNTIFGTARAILGGAVAPGSPVTFSFPLIAPVAPGTYNFQWQMGLESGTGAGVFGDLTPNLVINVGAIGNDAAFVSQTVPANMTAGQTYNVSVVLRNTGSNAWSEVAKYRLGSQNPLDNFTWGRARVLLPGDVAPGQEVAFNFPVTSPLTPGTYAFEWQMVQEGVTVFGQRSATVSVTVAPAGDDAAFVTENVPSSVSPGQLYNFSITMQNSGVNTWTPTTHRLVSVNPTENTVWGIGRLLLTAPVAPGGNAVFAGAITPPSRAGEFPFQWQMMSDASGLFGAVTPNLPITVQQPVNNSVFVSQNVPTRMAPGQGYDVQVVLRNTGANPWSQAGLYNLASQNPPDNFTWGVARAPLPGLVAVGAEAAFNFRVFAPVVAGTYNFQWRMVQEGVEFFGALSTNVVITVGTPENDALFVTHTAPASVTTGEVFTATVTVRNIGLSTWSAANGFTLGSQNPAENLRWGVNSVPLLGVVPPGEETTFTIPLTAPAVPGSYNLQWQMQRAGVGSFGSLSPNLVVAVTTPTAPFNAAAFGTQTVPAVMEPGTIYIASITMTNTGTTTWRGDQLFRLGAQNPANNLTWDINRVGLPSATIPPGGTATFDFQVRGPATPGVYNFQWQMVQDGVGFFGDLSPIVSVIVGSVPTDNAGFVSQEIPPSIAAGQTFTATVTMRNLSGITWTAAAGYQLGAQNPADTLRWGINRAALAAPVAAGETGVFTLSLVAPTSPGLYDFQWQMFRDGAGFFGDPSTNAVINVTAPPPAVNNASFVSQNIPTTMVAGQTYPISITLSNSGTAGWTRERLYRLASVNPLDNLRFNVNRVLLPAPTGAGGLVTFAFNVTAPIVPGDYDCQWRMVQEAVAFFGAPTPNVVVTVVPLANSALFVSQSAPQTVLTGQVFTATVTMRNNGATTWTPEDLFRLRTENPADTLTWAINRALLTGPVRPGESFTFTAQLVAPATPGSYNLQWGMVKEATGPFGQLSPNLAINVIAPSPVANDALFVSQDVPIAMNPGQIYIASITMANVGSAAWTADRRFRLGAQNPANNLTWDINRVGLPGNIPAGGNATFDFQVTAPAAPGAYNFQWQMVLDDDGAGFFGGRSSNLVVIVGAPGDNAQFIQQNVPLTLTQGQSFTAVITLRNNGGSTWTTDGGYQLGSQSPADNLTWGFNRTDLPAAVPPGQSVDFSFQLTAPTEPGTYDFQWQMVRTVTGFFGQPAAKLAITVAPLVPPTNNAGFIAQTVPGTMSPGTVYPVSITMTNTGTTTWTAEELYRLASQNPLDNLAWGLNRVVLPASVPPGGTAQFDFNVTAPTTPGVYQFQWQMVQEGKAIFGEATPSVTVIVSGEVNAAAFVSQRVPAVMNKGQRYPVSITFKNVGDSTWTREAKFKLGSQNALDNIVFGLNRVGLLAPVAPGATVTFNFIVAPPETGGLHDFQWQMVQEGKGFFGERTPNVAVSVVTSSGLGNQAVFVAQTVPSNLVAGSLNPVSVTMRNNGTNIWTAGARYKLGAQNPADSTIWNINRVLLPRDVAPGESVTFSFNIKAPAVARNYNFQWQMLQEGVGWFGQLTPNLIVTVGTLAPPAITKDPTNLVVVAGQSATFSVTAIGAAPLGYQWQRNGSAIPGATGTSYTIFSTTLADHNAQFRCVVTNALGTAISATALLAVADVGIPSVTGVTPAANATTVPANITVTAAFSQAMDPSSINGQTFKLLPSGSTNPVTALVFYDVAARTASLNPLQDLTPGGSYTVRIAGGVGGVRSLAGVPLPAEVNWGFSIIDTQPVNVAAITPTNGTRQVTVGSAIRVTFTKPVDPASITTATLTVIRKSTTTPVPATVSYDPATRTATLTPTVALLPNWTYTATVLGGPEGIRGLDGIVMSATQTSVFYTTDTLPPRIFNVAATVITSRSATIRWETNENADSQVRYGLTAAYEISTPVNPTLVLDHAVNLTGLLPNTTYHYQVRSRDGLNNQGGTPTDLVFTTLP